MGTVHCLEPFRTAQRYRGRPNLYGRLVKAIVEDQKNGLTGRLALHEAFEEKRRCPPEPPKGAA
jgi:hypothetical protein